MMPAILHSTNMKQIFFESHTFVTLDLRGLVLLVTETPTVTVSFYKIMRDLLI